MKSTAKTVLTELYRKKRFALKRTLEVTNKD